MKHLRDLLALALLGLACLTCWDLHLWIAGTRKRTDAILTHADAAAARMQRTMEKVEAASMQEQAASQRALEILGQTAALLQSTDETVQRAGLAAEAARATMVSAQGAAGSVTEHANQSLDALTGTLGQAQIAVQWLGKTMQDTDGLVSSREIGEALHNFSASSANLADTTASLSDSAKHVDAYVARVTKPARTIKSVALALGDFGLRVLGDLHVF